MLSLVGVAACVLGQAGEVSPSPMQTEWIKDHAIPIKSVEAGNGFEDLEPLAAFIGDARIVALGEPTHGTREAFQMKHRLVEYLCTKLGFTVFSIEANMPESYAVDGYVRGGRGDPESLITGMYFWTWRTEEVAAMVRWMRAHNEGGGSVRFTGFDMQTPDVAAQIAMDFIKATDPEHAPEAQRIFEAVMGAELSTARGPTVNYGVVTGELPIGAVRGKTVRFSGWIRTRDLAHGSAALWVRADGEKGKVLLLDTMQGRGAFGTREWSRFTLEAAIPEETKRVLFGTLMPGMGESWFDDLSVEIDGQPWESGPDFDLGFESPTLRGFKPGLQGSRAPGYAAEVDHDVARSGKGSLRLRSLADGPEKNAKELAAAAAGVVKRMAERGGEREGSDWAVQNARVVAQCAEMKAGNGFFVRDRSMAENVKWILDHAPAGTKIILWAHNGHIARQPGWMGWHLAKMYGKDYLAIGFAAGSGTYTAVGEGGLGTHDLRPPAVGSVEWRCAMTGLGNLILKTRGADAGNLDCRWLTEPAQIRSIGALAQEEQFAEQVLSKEYDAVIYLHETTAARTFPRR